MKSPYAASDKRCRAHIVDDQIAVPFRARPRIVSSESPEHAPGIARPPFQNGERGQLTCRPSSVLSARPVPFGARASVASQSRRDNRPGTRFSWELRDVP